MIGYRLMKDGNMWCAMDMGFVDLMESDAGFGETQQDAVHDLIRQTGNSVALSAFEVGGYCRRCREWIAEESEPDGCRDPRCPVSS